MLIRVLVAVLTLLGPLPLRVCTCAAAAVPPPEPIRLLAPTPAAPKACRCHHTAAGTGQTEQAVCPASQKTESDIAVGHPRGGHERDCPAISPRPLVREAVTVPPPVDASLDSAALLTVSLGFPSHAPNREGPVLPPAVPSVPLYLSLLTLRI